LGILLLKNAMTDKQLDIASKYILTFILIANFKPLLVGMQKGKILPLTDFKRPEG
jgi:hypothetical protein